MKTKETNQLFSKIFVDGTAVTNRIKYTILQWGAAAIHFTLIFIFASLGVKIMAVFNIVSTICYVLCGILVKKERYILFYYIAFVKYVCIPTQPPSLWAGRRDFHCTSSA